MMDTMSLELLGIPCREGEQVTLQMSMGSTGSRLTGRLH